MSPTEPQSVIVIGGGFAGLASAGLLAAAGHRVTLLEQGEHLGGRAGRLHRGGFSFDTGPSWYLMPEVFEHWFGLMGTSVQRELDLVELETSYRTFFEGQPPVDLSPQTAAATFESLEPGAGSRLRDYLAQSSGNYQLALEHFLYDDFARPGNLAKGSILRRLPQLLPLLLRSLHDHGAARFQDPRLRQLLGYPAVFLGSSPRRTPALYHLMSHLDLVEGVRYPRGGFSALVDAMARTAEAAGVLLVTRARVTELSTDGADGAVSAVQWIDEHNDTHRSPAQIVVGAADLHHLEHQLLPPARRTRSKRQWNRADPGPSAVLLCLGIKGKLPQLEHHNLFFTRDWDENFSRIDSGRPLQAETSIYACMPSATDDTVAPEGHENLFVLIPAPAAPSWGRGGADGTGDTMVEQVAEAAIDQVARWAGIDDLRQRIVVRQSFGPADFAQNFGAWQGGALGLAHTLGQSAFLRPGIRNPKVPGLYYAGSSVRPGIGIPMCLISAELVAKAVAGVSAPGPLPLPVPAGEPS
ncbi:phytoene desaturase family protein [Glutamicibacter sp. MNS18]|uniref:phytoene desaturase family protein n=1 Tax=Glutamicibacter sp. MNS18 TaxID=2989817 RepID=UPI002235E766|nr:phytoene desaturase family protein [Glutamicibacter sp. MNS18]MCW4466114.1 phytoene desaturase family protein [Glutamicibacter sp. MNS18]